MRRDDSPRAKAEGLELRFFPAQGHTLAAWLWDADAGFWIAAGSKELECGRGRGRGNQHALAGDDPAWANHEFKSDVTNENMDILVALACNVGVAL